MVIPGPRWPVRCPTPEKKIRELTREAAETHIRPGVRSGGQLEAYECPCGLYHLRNKKKNQRGGTAEQYIARQLAADLAALADEAMQAIPEEER